MRNRISINVDALFRGCLTDYVVKCIKRWNMNQITLIITNYFHIFISFRMHILIPFIKSEIIFQNTFKYLMRLQQFLEGWSIIKNNGKNSSFFSRKWIDFLIESISSIFSLDPSLLTKCPASIGARPCSLQMTGEWEVGGLMAERLGLLIRRLSVRFPAVRNDIVSLGKTIPSTCLRGNVPVLTVSHSG